MAGPAGRPPVTLVMVTYNSAAHVAAALDALLSDPSGPAEIVVVDNASVDDTAAIVARYPVRWVPLAENTGYGGGCHAGVAAATYPTLAFLSPDNTPVAGWLPPLVAALDEPGVGAAMVTLEQAIAPGTWNTSGGALSYVGLAWVTETGDPIPTQGRAPVEVPFPTGAAMAMRRDVWGHVGGFRPELFLYHEDSDLGWRLQMAGMHTVRVPASRVLHDYDFGRNPRKMFYLERNRWILLATNYRRSTLLALLPALVVTELGTVVAAVRDGWLGEKVAAWRDVIRRRRWIRSEYRRIQAGRRVGDVAILEGMAPDLGGITQVNAPPGSDVINRLLRMLLRAALPLVRRLDRRRGFAA
jgi:GT2 family glycosyltransferase